MEGVGVLFDVPGDFCTVDAGAERVERGLDGVADAGGDAVGLLAVGFFVLPVERSDRFWLACVVFEPADGPLPWVLGVFTCAEGDEVRGFVRAVIVRL